MPNRSSSDINQIAARIVEQATANGNTFEGKNPAAVALGRLGGLRGGKARARALSPEEREAIAKKAAQTRWKSHKKGL
jgi:hypothetical protein